MRELSLYDFSNVYGGTNRLDALATGTVAHVAGFFVGGWLNNRLDLVGAVDSGKGGWVVPLISDVIVESSGAWNIIPSFRQPLAFFVGAVCGMGYGFDHAQPGRHGDVCVEP